MHILSLALGGCLRGEPVRYGITEDTGGHIGYILGEMRALSLRGDVRCAEIVTRRFDAPELGTVHARREEWLAPKLVLRRIDSGNPDYLAKEALGADREAFTTALIEELRSRERLPDLIHAHFADAADVAARIQRVFGIPFVYTAHSLGMDKLKASGFRTQALRQRIEEEDCAIARAAAVVGSSRDECERQLASYPSASVDRIHRLTPGTAPADPQPAKIEAARALVAPFLRDPQRPMVLAVARAVHKKNLVGLVEAFAGEPGLRSQCNLVIVAGQRQSLNEGEAEQREVMNALADAIDRHDLYGCVAYPKTHSRPEVEGLYALAARSRGVFANPAQVEPYGLTLVEAATFGLPVVATKIGGAHDIVLELGHGTLIDPEDTAGIGRAIRELIADRNAWNAKSANGLGNVRSMTWEDYAARFVELARSILAPARVPANCIARRALVVSDLDNTLTGCPEGARRFSDFCRRHPDHGFIVATGRSIGEARRLVRDWGLPEPLSWITSVGTEIYHRAENRLVPDEGFVRAIGDEWQPRAIAAALEDIAGLTAQAGYEQRSFKRSYFAEDAAAVTEIEARLERRSLEARVIYSHGNLLDIVPREAGKGAALAHVARHHDVPLDRVFAAGDSGNDADMLSLCQNAILVGNHAPEVAALAGLANVYVSRRSHAAGALEGIIAHRARHRADDRAEARDRSEAA